MSEKYKYNFEKKDAVRWLLNSIKMSCSVHNAIAREIETDKEKFNAALSFFCRCYHLDLGNNNA